MEIWAMEPRALRDLVASIEGARRRRGTEPAAEPEDAPGYDLQNGVARIAIRGPIVPRAPWWATLLGIRIAAVDQLRRALSAAEADPQVKSVALLVNSPGGIVDGVDDLAQAVRTTGRRKPVVAAVEGIAASAAYWVASQATRVTASRTSIVGSIGVYSVVVDASAAAEGQGIKVHVIRSGPHKGAGVLGAAVSKEQLAAQQEIIDALAGIFVGAVAAGRRLSPKAAQNLATGKTWLGAQAKTLGLVDDVLAPEHALALAAARPTASSSPAPARSSAPSPAEQKRRAEAAARAQAEERQRQNAAQRAEAFAGVLRASRFADVEVDGARVRFRRRATDAWQEQSFAGAGRPKAPKPTAEQEAAARAKRLREAGLEVEQNGTRVRYRHRRCGWRKGPGPWQECAS